MLFSQLPQKVFLEGDAGGLPGKYECRLLLAREPFLTLTGLELAEKPFILPLGTKLAIGFGAEIGWVEFECEVVGWSAGREGTQVMLRCPNEGRIHQRRRHPRYPAERRIILTAPPPEATGETHNLSESGLCVNFPMPLPENRNLEFLLLPETKSPIGVKGQVVWQQVSADSARYLAGISLSNRQDWPGLSGQTGEEVKVSSSGGGN